MKKPQVAGCVLILSALFILSGCLPWTYRRDSSVHREIIFERTNSQGLVIQKLTRERIFSSMDVLITPEGGGKMWGIPSCKYFLEETGKPRQELPFLGFDKYNEHFDYLPVEHSSLWVGTKIDEIYHENRAKLLLIKFDDKHMLYKWTFELNTNNLIQKIYQLDEFHFTDGNHSIIYSTLEGIK